MDDLAFPPFLARPTRLAPEEIARIIGDPNKPRDWARIKTPEECKAVTKVNLFITDRAAPVQVYVSGGSIDKPVKTFSGMDAFEAWYKPSIGRYLSGQSGKEMTIVFLEAIKETKASKPAIVKAAVDADDKRLLQKITGVFEKSGTLPEPKSVPSVRTTGALVTVNGTEYHSVKVAFAALGLPMPKRYKFRRELKVAGSKTYSHEGKDYNFKTGGK